MVFNSKLNKDIFFFCKKLLPPILIIRKIFDFYKVKRNLSGKQGGILGKTKKAIVLGP
jgi:hypothetical protein